MKATPEVLALVADRLPVDFELPVPSVLSPTQFIDRCTE